MPSEVEDLQDRKRKLQTEIDNMQKQILMLNNELKSKQNILKKSKPGAPAPRPPGGPNVEVNHPKTGVYLELNEELAAKDQQIEQLNDRIIVQDHEIK